MENLLDIDKLGGYMIRFVVKIGSRTAHPALRCTNCTLSLDSDVPSALCACDFVQNSIPFEQRYSVIVCSSGHIYSFA